MPGVMGSHRYHIVMISVSGVATFHPSRWGMKVPPPIHLVPWREKEHMPGGWLVQII